MIEEVMQKFARDREQEFNLELILQKFGEIHSHMIPETTSEEEERAETHKTVLNLFEQFTKIELIGMLLLTEEGNIESSTPYSHSAPTIAQKLGINMSLVEDKNKAIVAMMRREGKNPVDNVSEYSELIEENLTKRELAATSALLLKYTMEKQITDGVKDLLSRLAQSMK